MKQQIAILALVLAASAGAAAAQSMSNVQVTIAADGKALLTWTGDPQQKGGGGIGIGVPIADDSAYQVGYADFPFAVIADAIAVTNYTTDKNDPTQYSATIPLTQWNTTYYFGVYDPKADQIIIVNGSTGSQPDQVPPDITVLSAVSFSGQVVLSWTAAGDDGMTGRASRYDIRYTDKGPMDGAMWAGPYAIALGGSPTPAAPGSAESMIVQGLAPGITYHFGLKTGDAVPNWSPLSVSVSVTLQADTVGPAAMTLEAGVVLDDSLTLSWVATGDDDMLGTASSYDLRYSTAGPIVTDADFSAATPLPDRPAPAPAGTTQGMRVSDLAPHTDYHFAIRATDEAGHASPLATVSVQTLHVIGSSGPTQACSAGAPVALPLLAVVLLLAALPVIRR